MERENAPSLILAAMLAFADGIMETVMDSSVVGDHLNTIWVAKRVQSSLATGTAIR